MKIAVDTNILARYYVEDTTDPEARRQRPVAARLLREAEHVHVPLTVVLELSWVLRSFYGFEAEPCARALEHLIGLPNVTVENWPAVLEASRWHRDGLDFADALHLACAADCDRMLTFDDRGFARRAKRLAVTPAVEVAK